MDYLQWNNSIASHFFNEEMAGREVLLFVTEPLIQKLGEHRNSTLNDFIQAIKAGPAWSTRQGLCQKAIQAFDHWRARGLVYPPYIGYLAFFVLAAGAEGHFASHAYYPRIWQLLGDTKNSGQPPSFEKMIELWDDLEKWSREDRNEDWGRFVARIRGNWWRIGLPLSQTLLSEDERKKLPELFSKAGLDPADPPTAERLADILFTEGHGIFERRTLRLLNSEEADEITLRNALGELLLDELSAWDGIAPQVFEGKGSTAPMANSGLKICLQIDRLAQRAKAYLRLKTGRPMPEEGLTFTDKLNSNVWLCKETLPGWSAPLKELNTSSGVNVDAAAADWTEGLELIDSEAAWRARLKGTTARLFFNGHNEGLPDWVESNRLVRNKEFLLACTGTGVAEKIRNWGEHFCDSFEERPTQGLPDGWVLFYGMNAHQSCPEIGVLTLSTTVRLLFKGGIKSRRGNTYLRFAPPVIIIDNASGHERILINDSELKSQNMMSNEWRLPASTQIGHTIAIKVECNGQCLVRRNLRFEEPDLPNSYSSVPWRLSSGEISDHDPSIPLVQGPSTFLPGGKDENPHFRMTLPLYLSERIIFLGRRPGEISDWPGESLPSSWHPVWALAKADRKHWVVHFCGQPSDAEIDQKPGDPLTENAVVKRWKEAVWTERKVTRPPALVQLQAVWANYMRAARHV